MSGHDSFELGAAPKTPETWKWTSLGEIAEVCGGITLNKAREIEDPVEVPYLRVANVQRGHLLLNEIKTVQISKNRLNDYLLLPGDVLFNEGGDRDKLGRGWVWNGEIANCCHQNHVFRARINGKLADGKFVSYWGNEFGQEYFKREGKQTTNLASINRQKLRALPLPLPPLDEQKRIVAKIEELFSELDAGEESLRKARRQLGTYRQSLLKQAFEGSLTASWREQNPHLLESRDVASVGTLERLPPQWRSINLGSVTENPIYGTAKKCAYEIAGVGVLRIPNVVNEAIDSTDLKFAEFTEDEIASYALKAGDLLMIRSNGSVSIVGRCALVEAKHTEFLFAGYLIRLRPIKALIDPEFLRSQLSSLMLRAQIEFSAKSTSGPFRPE